MLRAYLLIICDPQYRFQIANILEKMDNVVNVDVINGPYDLVVEIIFDTMDDLKEKLQNKVITKPKLKLTDTIIILYYCSLSLLNCYHCN